MQLIQQQHWRVAHFRVAADDINYRRFFNINDLAGLRMELPEVFDQAHQPRAASWSRTVRSMDCASITSTGCTIRKRTCAGCRGVSPRAGKVRDRSTWWWRRSCPRTRACARTGRSTAPRATTFSISSSRS